jgi:hypothetical protein
MKYVLNILSALLVFSSSAHAAPDSVDNLAGQGMPRGLGKVFQDTMIGVDTSGNVVIPIASGKKAQFKIAGTPAAELSATGLNFTGSAIQVGNTTLPPVMTPMTAITPVAAAALVARVSIMATAAPTFAIVTLPVATANAGKVFGVYNKGASPLLITANGVLDATDTINALGAAGTPYSCATTKFCDCRVIGAGTYMCVSQ